MKLKVSHEKKLQKLKNGKLEKGKINYNLPFSLKTLGKKRHF